MRIPKLGGDAGFLLIKALSYQHCKTFGSADDTRIRGAAKIEQDLGSDVWDAFSERTVIDYGCGLGHEAVAIACRGAKRVYGIDIQRASLDAAAALAKREGVTDRCVFLDGLQQRDEIEALYGTADYIYALDSFEHLSRPDESLAEIFRLLKPGGRLLINFGPPWKHPYGCHLRYITPVPWIHLYFEEPTIMALRAVFRDDGAKTFDEVPGGLNRMTVARFIQLVRHQSFEIETFQLLPVRRCAFLTNSKWLREYFTSAIKCTLRKPLTPCAVDATPAQQTVVRVGP